MTNIITEIEQQAEKMVPALLAHSGEIEHLVLQAIPHPVYDVTYKSAVRVSALLGTILTTLNPLVQYVENSVAQVALLELESILDTNEKLRPVGGILKAALSASTVSGMLATVTDIKSKLDSVLLPPAGSAILRELPAVILEVDAFLHVHGVPELDASTLAILKALAANSPDTKN